MADEKLSELPVISDPLLGSDQFYIVRSGVSYQGTLDQIIAQVPTTVAWGDITGTLGNQADLTAALALKAPLASPTFTGVPAAPTAAPGTNTTQIATTAFVLANGGGSGTVSSVTSADANATVANQTTTPVITIVSAPKWATARNLAGNSVDGSGNVAFANKFIVQGTADSGLSGAQFLGALGTGIVKNTTTTGVLSIAVAGDFPTLNQNTTGSAATLTTPRAINGVNFDGSAAITVTAAAGTLTGTTLNSTVVTSSLTTVGALASGSLATGFVVGGVTMTLGSDAANDIYYRNSSGVLTRLANGTTGQFLSATTGAAPSWGTPSGSGTVTHTGNLTANAVVLGNGTADVTVSTAFVTDGVSILTVGVAGASTSGAVIIKGKTSGSLKITVNDATAQAIVIGVAAQTTGGATLTIPNFAGVGDTFVFNTLAATLSNKTLAAPAIDLGLTTVSGAFNVDFSSFSGTFKTTTGATTLGSSATVNGVVLAPEIQQNVQSGTYTIVLSDANKQIVATSGTGDWTIPANASVAFPIGTTLVFLVIGAIASRTIAITSDTMYWAPTAATGTRTLAAGGIATALKVDTTTWVISGVGLT